MKGKTREEVHDWATAVRLQSLDMTRDLRPGPEGTEHLYDLVMLVNAACGLIQGFLYPQDDLAKATGADMGEA